MLFFFYLKEIVVVQSILLGILGVEYLQVKYSHRIVWSSQHHHGGSNNNLPACTAPYNASTLVQ